MCAPTKHITRTGINFYDIFSLYFKNRKMPLPFGFALSAMRAVRQYHHASPFTRPHLLKRLYLFRLGAYGMFAFVCCTLYDTVPVQIPK